jgi:hypothetical protein
MTLVEILGASFIGCVLTFTLMSILKSISLQEKNSSQSQDFNTLASIILVRSQNPCKDSGSNPPSYIKKNFGTPPTPGPQTAFPLGSNNSLAVAFIIDPTSAQPLLASAGTLINGVYYQLQLERDPNWSSCPSSPANTFDPLLETCLGSLWLSTVRKEGGPGSLGLKTSRRMVASIIYYDSSNFAVCPPTNLNPYIFNGWSSSSPLKQCKRIDIPSPSTQQEFYCPPGQYMTAVYASPFSADPSILGLFPAKITSGAYLSSMGFECCNVPF